MTKFFIALAALVGMGLWAAPVAAQSCCAASQTAGPVRLSAGQVGNLSMGVDGRLYSGVFVGNEYRRLDNPGHEMRQSLSGALRLGDDWQVGATVPFVQNRRESDDHSEWGFGIGDVGAQARYEIVTTGMSMTWPGIGVVASAVAPSGTSPKQSMQRGDKLLQADVTGAGLWQFGLATQVEWTSRRSFLAVELGARQALPYVDARGADVWNGPGISGRISTGRILDFPLLWDQSLYLAGGISTDHSGAKKVDGERIEHTTERMTTLSVQAGGYLTETLYLMVRSSWDLPVNIAGANRQGGPGVGLVLRKVFYDY